MAKPMGPTINLGHRGNQSGGGESLIYLFTNTYYMPDIILGTLQVSAHLILILILWGKHCFYSHSTDEEIGS